MKQSSTNGFNRILVTSSSHVPSPKKGLNSTKKKRTKMMFVKTKEPCAKLQMADKRELKFCKY